MLPNDEYKLVADFQNENNLNQVVEMLITPLTCLSAYSQLLKTLRKDSTNEKEINYLKELEDNIKKLNTSIHTFLTLIDSSLVYKKTKCV